MEDSTAAKVCCSCGYSLPLSAFSIRKRSSDGRQSKCRGCFSAYLKAYHEANRERLNASRVARASSEAERDPERARLRRIRYYQANPEKARARSQAWRSANPEAVKEARQKYAESNRDLIREKQRQFRERNREACLASLKAWRERNPEKSREYDHLRRAREADAFIGPIDPEALWTGACGICGEPIDRTLKRPDPLSPSIDHIMPIARGGSHSQANLQWAHLVCNMRKGAKVISPP